MSLQPVKVFPSARGVYDQQKFFRRDSIDDQIVDNTAVFIEQESVLAGSDLKILGVIGEHFVKPASRRWAFGDQLAHVGDIENTYVISDGLVFVTNASVL